MNRGERFLVRDVVEALKTVDPTLPITVKVWLVDEDGLYDQDVEFAKIYTRSIDVLIETTKP